MKVPVALLLVGALLAPAGVEGAEVTAFDYTQVGGLSEPVHQQAVTESVFLPMTDGTEIYIEITRPVTGDKVPVIAELSPYHGFVQPRNGERMLPDEPDGLISYFVPRGYAVMMMDLRGTGRSEGCLDHMGPKDQSDVKKVVEWAALRPWSNGRVAALGHSYPGGTSVMTLAQQPRGLATVVVSAGLGSMYEHQFQGGVPYNFQWGGPVFGYPLISLARFFDEKFLDGMQDAGCGVENNALIANESSLSGRYHSWHADRDFRVAAARAPIPAFVTHGTNDEAARVAALDWFLRRDGSRRDKLWLGQWDHGSGCCPNRRGEQWTKALHAWFDRHLLGRAVDTGPAVELFLADGPRQAVIGGARTEVVERDLFPGAPRMKSLYPTSSGGLNESPGPSGRVSFVGTPLGFGDPSGAPGATFRTPALQQDQLLAGVPELDITASFTMPRTHLIANLFDEDPSGEWRRISQFAINPELRGGVGTSNVVVPLRPYRLSPPGFAMAHRLRAGHRLVLRVVTSDPDKVPLFALDPNVTVFTSRTTLRLPVVDDPVWRADTVPLEVP